VTLAVALGACLHLDISSKSSLPTDEVEFYLRQMNSPGGEWELIRQIGGQPRPFAHQRAGAFWSVTVTESAGAFGRPLNSTTTQLPGLISAAVTGLVLNRCSRSSGCSSRVDTTIFVSGPSRTVTWRSFPSTEFVEDKMIGAHAEHRSGVSSPCNRDCGEDGEREDGAGNSTGSQPLTHNISP
jgi:hypothetical protein